MNALFNPHEVRFGVTVDRAGGYVGRLTFRGLELWRCQHGHLGRGPAQSCGFRSWQQLRAWLDGREAVAA